MEWTAAGERTTRSPLQSVRARSAPVVPFLWDEVTLRDSTLLALQTDIGEIDLLAEVTGLGTHEEVKQHAITIQAFERNVVTLDLPALIRAKCAAGREKDLFGLDELESLLEAGDE